MATAQQIGKTKPKEILIELCDMRESGFVRDDTQGTPYEERLNCPMVLFIPNQSFRINEKGALEEIRYISKRDVISVEEQNRLGIKPSPRSTADKIMVKNGRMSVVRDGQYKSLYDFLVENVEFNASNPKLLDGAKPLYKVVDLQKIEEEFNEQAILENEAMAFVFSLQAKKGDIWIYKEDRINSLAELMNCFAETPAGKIGLLASVAKSNPRTFLETVKSYEQTSVTLVTHALSFNIIEISGNSFMYKEGNKILKSLGAGEMKKEEKIEAVAQWLRTSEGAAAFQELSALVDVAREGKADKE